MKHLNDALGIEPEEIIPTKKALVTIDHNQTDAEADYQLARETFRNLVKKGSDAVSSIGDLASIAESPAAYGVMATLIKSVSDTTKDLYDLHKKTKDLKSDGRPIETINVDKAVFVGSTADFLKKIKDDKSNDVV